MADKTYTWDQNFLNNDPNEDTGLVRYGGRYTNQTRESLTERLVDEHEWDITEPAPQPKMGAHKNGSAKSYYTGADPVYRPDGTTVLDSDDAGRLWFDYVNGQIKGWNGTAWVNLSAQGVGTILRWQSTAQYFGDEIVEDKGILWRADVPTPTIGVDPDEPEWKLFEVGMPEDIVWTEYLTYTVDQLVFSGGLFWVAVAPIKASPPGAVGGEWTPLELDTQSIADDAVTQDKIGPQAVGTTELEDLGVTTAKIADLNVTTGKIASQNVTTDKIADLNVTTEKLEASAVETAKIADANVTLAKLANDTKDILDWSATWTYLANDLVWYNSLIWKAVAPVLGNAPAQATPAEWIIWTFQTSESVSNTATILANYRDHIVYANTTTNPSYTVTLTDGAKEGDRVTAAAFGGGEITVAGTGLTDQTQLDTAITYLWNSTAGWIPLGGGSGSGTGLEVGEITWWAGPLSVNLPDTKLECDGSILNIADYPALFGRLGTTWGGDGVTTFGIPDLQGIHPGMVGQQDFNGTGRFKGDLTSAIGDYREDFMQQITGEWASRANTVSPAATGAFSTATISNESSNDTGRIGTILSFDSANSPDARTDDYTDVASAMGRWLIQAEAAEPTTVNAVVVDVQVGDVRWWGSDTIPTNDLKLDGSEYPQATYPELYAILGTTFNTGGETAGYFRLPNMQGIYPGAVGTQDINGNTKGDGTAVLGDYVEDQFQGHWHRVPYGSASGNSYANYGTGWNGSAYYNRSQDAVTDGVNGTPRTGEDTRPSSLMGHWIIRAQQPAAYTLVALSELFAVYEVDTDAGDVDITSLYPPSPTAGFSMFFTNTGTSRNHITGLPNSITLGDGKALKITYIGSSWYYEDVIIDEYSTTASGTNLSSATTAITKWSGGRMVQTLKDGTGSQSIRVWTFTESFDEAPIVTGSAVKSTDIIWHMQAVATTTTCEFRLSNAGGSGQASPSNALAEGRWKSGV